MTTPVPSPCVSVCRMDERTGWCVGCLRTLPEIGAWSTFGDDDKLAVWAALPQRRAASRNAQRGPSEAPGAALP